MKPEEKVVIEIREMEKLVMTNGQYFGDWGILEKRHRTASAFTLEDTDLFYLDAKAFESSFGVYFISLFRGVC